MLVSVAIPAYNGGEFLREAIDSVLAQTYKPIEIIVVDDGSSDNTREVCESYGQAVKYYYQQNDGTMGAGARARAVLEGSGQWVALLDQDDRWLPEKIEKQLRALNNCPDAVVAFTGFHHIDHRGQVVSEAFLNGPSGDVFHVLLTGNPYRASSALISRSVIDHCGQPVTDVGAADYDLWLRVARCHQVLFVDECLTEYRVHEASYSADRTRIAMAVRRTLEQYRSRLHPNCSECRRSFRHGWALIGTIAARACLDQFHITARAGEFVDSFSFLREAVHWSPRQVFRPIQILALSKSSALAMTRMMRKGLMRALESGFSIFQ